MEMRAVRGACLLVLTLALSVLLAAPAGAGQVVKLRVGLTPEHLGAGTTISFGFRIATPNGRVPPPLTALSLLYPANVGLVTSGLGLATCTPAALEADGPEACPADSLMGRGSALVEIPVGPELIQETGQLTAWMAPVQNGHLSLLFFADGKAPVNAQLIFPAVVLDANVPFGGRLDTAIPVIPTLPEAPNAAVVQLRTTIGPQNITYYRHERHRTIPYNPDGILLPPTCPHHGFPFAAAFTFLDGTHTTAHASVPCPTHTRGHH
jgi:hypothetical protein